MLALQITSMKLFMNQLLVNDSFDIFLLEEAAISTANTFTIDGHINPGFYSPEELSSIHSPEYEYTPWSLCRNLCFQLIKGKNTPLSFKFVFQLKPEITRRLLERENCSVDISQIKALVATVRYDGTKAMITSGCAYRTFVMSQEVQIIWDKTLAKYLDDRGIPYEIL